MRATEALAVGVLAEPGAKGMYVLSIFLRLDRMSYDRGSLGRIGLVEASVLKIGKLIEILIYCC